MEAGCSMEPHTSGGDREAIRHSRRRFLRWLLGGGLAVAATGGGGLVYATAVEPGWLDVERVIVRLADLPPALDGLRIAQLSDLHWGPYIGQREVRAAVQRANALVPDLVVLTGDYVLHSAGYAAPCAHELAALRAPLGVVAIPGNHDYWTDIDEVMAQLRTAGLVLLRNAALRLEVGGSALWLAGLDDVWEQRHDLEAALAKVPRNEPVVLLVHEPDVADQAARSPHRILLQLSGHSHGGQVNLPLLGRPILPWLGRVYPVGLQRVAGTALQVYTNRGVGLIAPPVRFGCRPEVTHLTLARAG
jgi:predicted MPP superfamily phosphohydrolase